MRQQNAEWLKKKKKKSNNYCVFYLKQIQIRYKYHNKNLRSIRGNRVHRNKGFFWPVLFFSWNIEYELLNNQSCLQHGYTFPHMNNSTVPPTSKACLEKHRKQKSARIKKRNWGKVQGARRGDKEVNQGKKKTLIQGMFFSISLFVCSTRQEPHMCSTASHHQENHNKKTISFRYVCTHKNEL